MKRQHQQQKETSRSDLQSECGWCFKKGICYNRLRTLLSQKLFSKSGEGAVNVSKVKELEGVLTTDEAVMVSYERVRIEKKTWVLIL